MANSIDKLASDIEFAKRLMESEKEETKGKNYLSKKKDEKEALLKKTNKILLMFGIKRKWRCLARWGLFSSRKPLSE